MRVMLALVALFAAAPAFAQSVTSTRVTTYDWQCQNADGSKVSNHQREGSAITACMNASLQDGAARYVQGGRYHIVVSLPDQQPAPTAGGTAVVSWTPPTTNTDGSALADLAGYRVRYGASPAALTHVLTVADPAAASGMVAGLTSGTWYFAVSAYTASGAESALSPMVSKTIP